MSDECFAASGGRRRDVLAAAFGVAAGATASCASTREAAGGVDMNTPILISGRELYRALQASDVAALRRIFSTDFQGDLTAGLPNGFGRHYDGLDEMISQGWAEVGRVFQMSPQPDRLIDGGDVLVGLGNYLGVAKPTGKSVRAAFAHFWSWNGAQFTGVRQVTDSGAWRDALQST